MVKKPRAGQRYIITVDRPHCADLKMGDIVIVEEDGFLAEDGVYEFRTKVLGWVLDTTVAVPVKGLSKLEKTIYGG